MVIGRRWCSTKWSSFLLKLLPARARADFVETEVCLTLDLGLPIIPILAEGVSMPDQSKLPISIRDLVRLNAAPVRAGKDFHADMFDVMNEVQKLRSCKIGT